jgi:hypothetical protein
MEHESIVDDDDEASFVPRRVLPHVLPDIFTLTSLIHHRTSSGIQPSRAREILLELPNLITQFSSPPALPNSSLGCVVPAPTTTSTAREHVYTSVADVMEAVDIKDPWLFTTILNMAAKAGMTGSVEEIFYNAKVAESRSWEIDRGKAIEDFLSTKHHSFSAQPIAPTSSSPGKAANSVTRADDSSSVAWSPWSLGPEAYTIMFQLYASERSKQGAAHGWSKMARLTGCLPPDFQIGASRDALAFETGLRLYYSAKESRQNTLERIMEMREEIARNQPETLRNEQRHLPSVPSNGHKEIALPLASHNYHTKQRRSGTPSPSRSPWPSIAHHVRAPDERFFVAAFNLFGRQPHRRRGGRKHGRLRGRTEGLDYAARRAVFGPHAARSAEPISMTDLPPMPNNQMGILATVARDSEGL